MWEKVREDGSRKLKRNAVPTLFSFSKQVKPRKPPKERSIDIQENRSIEINIPSTSTLESSSSSMDTDSSIAVTSQSSNLFDDDELERFKAENKKLLNKNLLLKKELRRSKKRNKALQSRLKQMELDTKQQKYFQLLHCVFNDDQIMALQNSMRFKRWSNKTITSSIKLKFACGNNGYQELIKQKIPLPSLRTLSRRLENLKFESGIIDEIFEFFKYKITSFTDEHMKDCGLVLDEMSITPSNMYDSSTRKYIGNVTLPEHTGVASNACVIMLVGITSRWKQTVAYYYTGNYDLCASLLFL